MKNKAYVYVSSFIFLVLSIFVDQWSKNLAVQHLKGQEPITIIPGVFKLQYLENRGAAFGMMQEKQGFFIAFTLIVVCFLVYIMRNCVNLYFKRKNLSCIWLLGSLVLLISGALGNLIDRVMNQYVVDFFYFSLIDFPIFNVADCYVTVSVALIFVIILFFMKEEDLNEVISFRRNKEI